MTVPSTPQPASPGDPGAPLSTVSDLARLRMLSRIAEQVGEGVAVSDNDGWFLYVNPTFAAQHAGTTAGLAGAHLSSFYREEDLAAVQPIISAALEQGIGRGDVTRLRRDGTVFPARITLSLLRDEAGDLIGRVLCVQDVTDRREMEEELRRAALYDPLTHLPNRRLLKDRIEHALVARERRRSDVAALFIDLDDFKGVNDTFGHEAGDAVLVEVSRRLEKCIRQVDTLSRHGGDEFVVLLEDVQSQDQAAAIGRRVLGAFSEPVRTHAGEVHVSASVGVHLARDGDDHDSLLRSADSAMFDAKRDDPGSMRLSPSGRS